MNADKIIVTVSGVDKVGIVAKVANNSISKKIFFCFILFCPFLFASTLTCPKIKLLMRQKKITLKINLR